MAQPSIIKAFPLGFGLALSVCGLQSDPAQAELQAHEFECAHPRLERMEQLQFARKNRFATTFNTVLLDGAVTSYPPSKTTYDRTLTSRLRVLVDIMGSPNLAFRLTAEGQSHFRKLESANEPRLQQEQMIYDAEVGLSSTYISTTGLELTLGAAVHRIPEYSYDTVTPSVTSRTSVSQAQAIIPAFSAVKRQGNGGAAGIFYQPHRLGERTISRVASESTTFKEEFLFPETIGVFGRFLAYGLRTDIEVSAVNLTDGGPRKSNGQTAADDYLRFHLFVTKALTMPVPIELSLRLVHKSLSYSSSTDVTLFSIPLTLVQLQAGIGNEMRTLFGGISYTYGADRQSIPEFNADYKMSGVGGVVGISWALTGGA